MSRYMNTA